MPYSDCVDHKQPVENFKEMKHLTILLRLLRNLYLNQETAIEPHVETEAD